MEPFNVTWMSLTYNCNNKCRWCYAASNFQEDNSKNFKSEKERDTINLLSELEVKNIILIGGEPTLYKNIYGLLEKTNDAKIDTGMVTNGRKLKDIDFTRGLKKRGLNYLTVSIEGSNQYMHDSLTQTKGSYQEAISGIQNAIDAGINVSTNTVISSKNVNKLEEIVISLKEIGIKDMGFNICGICTSNEENNAYLIHPKNASDSFVKMYQQFKEEGIKFRLVTPVPFCFFEGEIKKELTEKKIISGGPCQLVHGKNFVIDYNGDVVPCTHLTGYSLFNIFQEDEVITKEEFLKLYNQNSIHDLRKNIGKYPSEKCNTCNESCSGGCPLFWLKFNPDEEIRRTEND
jgi:radical SAM protein with 4Fe4S-binding SPASM domain